jgi:gliding motility-associated-like protein
VNCLRKLKLLLFIFLFCKQAVFSQYILNGSAQQNSCNCYTLTPATPTQSGSVWNSNKINLSTSFDFWFNVNLGCNDAGADGIVFILQPISTSIGSTGEGMGFGGVSPSIGIALDTYQNSNLTDPSFDHISIQKNGVVNHSGDLAGPVPISSVSNNVEDCQWHKLRITWDPSTKWLRTYFDGVLRVESQVDLVGSIFNNDPNVFWGFTGATGGAVNLQQFCTALDPIFSTGFPANIVCEGTPVQFTNSSESFAPIASYNWSFGDGTFSNAANPPPHVYAVPGNYPVTLKIKGLDGCERDSTKTITVASIPSADLQVFDTCLNGTPRVEFVAENVNVTYQWNIDGVPASGQQPLLTNLPVGTHQLQVIVSSTNNCGSPDTTDASFVIKPKPLVMPVVEDGCINEIIGFAGVQTDNVTTINQWNWSFGDNTNGAGQNSQHSYSQQGDYITKLWATATNNCASDTVERTVKINRAFAFAGNDTVIISNMPAQLQASGNGTFLWSPVVGLSNAAVSNPFITLSNDQEYTLSVTTPEGCTADDTIFVKVYNGPAVYVPSAFTPNGDGKNELLQPMYVGIKELKLFVVYNRWGQVVFQTKSMQKGWNGIRATGTFVWMVSAVNYLNQPILLKGTVTIIR